MQANNKEQVMNSISSGLRAFFDLAQLKLRRGRDFKKMTRAQQLQAGRALFTLRDIAAAPDKYFSRAATEGPWRARGAQYAATHGVNPEWAVFYLVPTPSDIVCDNVDAAFWSDYKLRVKFANFCMYVKDWYYDSTSSVPARLAVVGRDAEKIVALAKEVADEYSREKNGRVIHCMNKALAAVKQNKR